MLPILNASAHLYRVLSSVEPGGAIYTTVRLEYPQGARSASVISEQDLSQRMSAIPRKQFGGRAAYLLVHLLLTVQAFHRALDDGVCAEMLVQAREAVERHAQTDEVDCLV